MDNGGHRVTDEELDAAISTESSTKLRQLRAEFDEYRRETEFDADEAEATFQRLTSQMEDALGLYELIRDDNKRLKVENIRLRKIIIGLLAQLGIIDTGIQ